MTLQRCLLLPAPIHRRWRLFVFPASGFFLDRSFIFVIFLVLDDFPCPVEELLFVEQLSTVSDGVLARFEQFRLFLLAFVAPLRGQQSIDGFGTDEILDPHAAKRGGFRGHVVSHEFGHRVFLFGDLGSSIPSTTTAALLLRAPRSHCQHGKMMKLNRAAILVISFPFLEKNWNSRIHKCSSVFTCPLKC